MSQRCVLSTLIVWHTSEFQLDIPWCSFPTWSSFIRWHSFGFTNVYFPTRARYFVYSTEWRSDLKDFSRFVRSSLEAWKWFGCCVCSKSCRDSVYCSFYTWKKRLLLFNSFCDCLSCLVLVFADCRPHSSYIRFAVRFVSNGWVVYRRSDYRTKMETLVSNETYTRFDRDSNRNISILIEKSGFSSAKQYWNTNSLLSSTKSTKTIWFAKNI